LAVVMKSAAGGHEGLVMSAASMPASVASPSSAEVDFGNLYDVHVDFVWRMLERLGVSHESLEDATQDVFLVIHRRITGFLRASSIKTWIGAIAIKVASNYRRRVRRKGGLEPLAKADEVADPRSGPHDAIASAEAMKRVLGLLDGLNEEQRTVFILSELEEMSAPEIAEATETNVNTVYSRLRLGRERFNALLQADRDAGALE
jgi:RNA polymerase sigma-70 factor (ECF subfamily)